MSPPDEARAGHRVPSWLVPDGLVTGIGSLPATDPAEALDFVAAHATRLPFCPQPPATDLLTDTLEQQLDSVAAGTDRWFDHFEAACLAGAFPAALALKTQVTGPLTLAGLLGAGRREPLSPDLMAGLTEHVAGRAEHQAQRLGVLGLPVLVVLDEPALALTNSTRDPVRALLDVIFQRIRRTGARTGIHCCATTHPGALGALDCDVVSFDATYDHLLSESDVDVLDDPRRLIAFGLIGSGPEVESHGHAFARWLTQVLMVNDPAKLARRTIVTSRCGLGRSTMAEAEDAFRAAASVGNLISRIAGSPERFSKSFR
jgi:hypothetical protein